MPTVWTRVVARIVPLASIVMVAASLHAQPAPRRPRIVQACDRRFALVVLTVVDAGGAPVTDATVIVTRVRDGQRLAGGDPVLAEAGEYRVVDDDARAAIDSAGEAVRVQIRRGAERADTTFRIGRTPNGCHIRRLDGPDRVVVRRS